jgi:hypothetical protein
VIVEKTRLDMLRDIERDIKRLYVLKTGREFKPKDHPRDKEAASAYVEDEVLTVLKGIERELRPMVEKARGDGPDEGDTKPGAEGTLTFHGHRWRRPEEAGKDGSEAEAGDEKDSTPKSVDRTGTDYSGVSYEIAVSKELQYLKEQTEKTGHEFMSIMAKDRKICGTWEGNSSGVKLDEKILALLDNETYTDSIIVMHTHTNGTGFSGEDFWTMCRYKTIKEMRIICTDGAKYFAIVGGGQRATKEDIVTESSKISAHLLELPRYKSLNKSNSSGALFVRFIRERNDELRKVFGWILK